MTALNIDYRWTVPHQWLFTSWLYPEFLQVGVLFPQWSDVSKIMIPLYYGKFNSHSYRMSLGCGLHKSPPFYFLNLSRADVWLDNTAAFFSLSLISFSIFILSPIVFLITSCGAKKSRDMSQTLHIQQKSYCINLYRIFWIFYPLVHMSHLFLAPFNIPSRTTTLLLILGSKSFFGMWVKALGRQKMLLEKEGEQ